MKTINPNIQIARAIAVLMVLYIHAIQFLPQIILEGTVFLKDIRTWVWGGAGVDLFFVISGYVITMNANNWNSIKNYFLSRVVRIVPLYWTLTLLFVMYSYILSTDWSITSISINLFSILKSLFFIQDLSPAGVQQPVLSVGWSLNYEVFFYLVFGFIFFAKNKILNFFIASVITLLLINAKIYASYLFIFIIGVLIRVLLKNSLPKSNVVAIIFFVFSLPFLFFSSSPYMDGGILRTIVWGCASALLFMSLLILPDNRYFKWFLIIGNASYSIYLSHWFFRYLNSGNILSIYINVYGVVIVNILLMIIVGIFVYNYIELPMTRYFKLKLIK